MHHSFYSAAPRQPPSSPAKVGQVLEVQCKRLGVEGKGLCLVEGSSFVTLVSHALPGEKLRVQVTASSAKFAEAAVIERLTRNDHYVVPACPSFGTCGGCSLQSMGYEAQLREKQALLIETLKRGKIRSMEAVSFLPIVPSPSQYSYRNKTTLFWSLDEEGKPVLGMMKRGSQEAVPITHCHLADDTSNKLARLITASVASKCSNDARLLPSSSSSPSCIMKEVVIRNSSGEDGQANYFVIFVTTSDEPQCLRPIVEDLLASPLAASVVGILNRVSNNTQSKEGEGEEVEEGQRKRTQAKGYWRQPRDQEAVAGAGTTHILHGQDHLMDRLCGLSFKVAADAFAQVNPQQCQSLYASIKEVAGLRSTDTVLDLYCGTGTIGLTLARSVESLIGIEWNEAAVACADTNAVQNGILNAKFIAGDCGKILKRWCEGIKAEDLAKRSRTALSNQEAIRPDVVILDPARAGCSSGVIAYLEACGCRRIVYVSCSPATASRDLALLCGSSKPTDRSGAAAAVGGGRFALRSIQAFDMFPQTDHCELVAVLDRVQ